LSNADKGAVGLIPALELATLTLAPHDTDREKTGTMGMRTRTVTGPLIEQTLNSD